MVWSKIVLMEFVIVWILLGLISSAIVYVPWKKFKPFATAWKTLAPSCPIWKNVWGIPVMMDLRDNALWWSRHPEMDEKWQFPNVKSTIWDVGCNVGVYAVRAAMLGHRVVAFDISPKACWMLRQTASANGLDIHVVCTALSVEPWSFDPPRTSHTEEAVVKPGRIQSMTYLQAEAKFGTPAVIKMDIQGSESEFLGSVDFKQWMERNRVRWMLETHNGTHEHIWPGTQKVSENHYEFVSSFSSI